MNMVGGETSGLENKIFENEDKTAGEIDILDILDRDAILYVIEGQSGDSIAECIDGDYGCGCYSLCAVMYLRLESFL